MSIPYSTSLIHLFLSPQVHKGSLSMWVEVLERMAEAEAWLKPSVGKKEIFNAMTAYGNAKCRFQVRSTPNG